MLATAALMSSKSGLPHWSADWPSSRQEPPNRPRKNPLWPDLPDDLGAALARFDTVSVARAIDRAMIAAAREFADGVDAYRRHPYSRAAEDARIVWRAGGTALIDHGLIDHGEGVPA